MKRLILKIKKLIKSLKETIRFYYKRFKSDKSGRDIILELPKVKEIDFRIPRIHTLTWEQIKGIKVRTAIGISPLDVDTFGKRLSRHGQNQRHFNKKRHGFYLKKAKR